MLCCALVACDIRAGSEEDVSEEEFRPPPSAVEAVETIPAGLDADVVERGRALFVPCAVCHGLDGRGNQLGPSLRDSEWIHISGSLEEIEQVVRTGIPQPRDYPVPMVPMGGGDFDADELRAVSSYVYAISHPAAPAQ